MKNDRNYFLRQQIKLSPRARPSENPDKIRLKFLETPYRYYKALTRTQKSIIISLILTVSVPTIMYTAITKIVQWEYRTKLYAEMTDNFYEVKDLLDKTKHMK